jgi:hypothetical protein
MPTTITSFASILAWTVWQMLVELLYSLEELELNGKDFTTIGGEK